MVNLDINKNNMKNIKSIHWVLLVVVGLAVGSWWFSDSATCPRCACDVVTCCDDGVCDDIDCECGCKVTIQPVD